MRLRDGIIACAVASVWAVPLVWLVAVSFGSSQGDLAASGPAALSLENYRYLSDHGQIAPIWNSASLALVTAAVSVPLGFLVAFEAHQRRGAPLVWTLVLYKAAPASAVAIGAFGLMRLTGIANGLLLPAAMIVLTNIFFPVLLLFIALQRLPERLFDAMRIDGLSSVRRRLTTASLIWRDLLGAFALMILLAWGEAFLTGILTPHAGRPIAAEMLTFVSSFGAYWGRLAALVCLSLLPCVIFGPFAFFTVLTEPRADR